MFTGLEAETKTLAKLKVDIDPTLALEVATKQYVDHYSTWRRPNLQFGSVTTVAVESGLDGTSGDIPMLFPDGTVRTETSTTRTTFDITRNAVLVTSGAQSGLTGATSEATNTWYALYAVKITDSSTLWVTVGSTVIPIRANFATLNTAYGSSGWVYLGMIRNGDNSGATGDILTFSQTGNFTVFRNICAVSGLPSVAGIDLTSTASATSLSYTYASGTGAAQIPSHLTNVLYGACSGAAAATTIEYRSPSAQYFGITGKKATDFGMMQFAANAADGFNVVTDNAEKLEIFIGGFYDGVLGVGSNPIL